ncbi:ferredoxin [Thermodesulforhabdus norvegica]|uniref:Ferredoxin n=1 Tax=Thermodesulforhabdus norvegica TaxID=39841 RepID=A0A1I4UCP8_9BACT|nr:ferredoxin [Thermodesulforhabdus norvegica]SFM86746.1 ferredoxin [Thermodesulforhabdus norvegica]
MKKPTVDLSKCKLCMACVAVAPEVFKEVDESYIDVIERSEYPAEKVEEAINCCPSGCISWEDY